MSGKILYYKAESGKRTPAELKAKIAQIDVIIDELLTTAMTSVSNGNMIQYELDTGQSKQKVEYTEPSQVTAAVQMYEKIRQIYANKLQGRQVKLTNYKNFR